MRIPIEVAETDLDGNKDGSTPITRRYMAQQRYTLTAPASVANGGNAYLFCNWRYRANGGWIDQPAGERILAVDSIGTSTHTAEARYALQTSITVGSRNPTSGIPITVSVADEDGNRNGTTRFTRRYKGGTAVGLTAPTQNGIHPFRRWYISNIAQPIGQRTIVVQPLVSSTTVEAEYFTRVVADVRSYGRGCTGSNRLIPDHAAAGLPEGRTVADYQVRGVPSKTPMALFLGFSDSKWNGTPLPLRLGFIGADPSCAILAEGFLILPVTADATGFGTIGVPVTGDPAAIGTHFYTQYVVVDFGVAAPLKITVSNGLDSTIGGWR